MIDHAHHLALLGLNKLIFFFFFHNYNLTNFDQAALLYKQIQTTFIKTSRKQTMKYPKITCLFSWLLGHAPVS